MSVGVDRLSVSFPVGGFDDSPGQWDEIKRKRRSWGDGPKTATAYEVEHGLRDDGPHSGEFVTTFVKTERLSDCQIYVSITEVPEAQGHKWWGKVECNPSRIVDPEGCGLAMVEQLPEVVEVVELAGSIGMEAAEPVAEWRVKRVDVARDFQGVEDSGRLIRGLASIHRPYSKQNMVYADPRANHAQTLMVGNGTGKTRLYDKFAETKGEAPEGTVRWETQARSDWLKAIGGIKKVSDLNREQIGQLAVNRWEWSAMGVEVASSIGRLVRAVQESEGLTEREVAFFLGWLMCEAAGRPMRSLSTATLAKYRRMQRDLGIAAPSDFEGMVEVVSRLDWESGTEVLRVA